MTSQASILVDGSQIQHYVIESFYFESSDAIFYRVYNQMDGQYYLLRSIKPYPCSAQSLPSTSTDLQDIESNWQQVKHPFVLPILATIETEEGDFQLFSDIKLVGLIGLSTNDKENWQTEVLNLTSIISVLVDNLPPEQLNITEQLIIDDAGSVYLIPSPNINRNSDDLVKCINKQVAQSVIYLLTKESFLVDGSEPLKVAYQRLHNQWRESAPKDVDRKIKELLLQGILGDTDVMILPQIKAVLKPSGSMSSKRKLITGAILTCFLVLLCAGYYVVQKNQRGPEWHQAQLINAIELQDGIKLTLLQIQQQLKLKSTLPLTVDLLLRLDVEQTLADAKAIKQRADSNVIAEAMEKGIDQYKQAQRQLSELANELKAIKQIEDLNNSHRLPSQLLQEQDQLWQPSFIQKLYKRVNVAWQELDSASRFTEWLDNYQEDVKQLKEAVSITNELGVSFDEASSLAKSMPPLINDLPKKLLDTVITSTDITDFQVKAKKAKTVSAIASITEDLKSKVSDAKALKMSLLDYQHNAQLLQAAMKGKQLSDKQLNVTAPDTLSPILNTIADLKADGEIALAVTQQKSLLDTLSQIDKQVQSIKVIQPQLAPLYSQLERWRQKGVTLKPTITEYKNYHADINVLIEQGKLTQANTNMTALHQQLSKAVSAVDQGYKQYTLAHDQWKVEVEQGELEIKDAKDLLSEAHDELDSIGSEQDCSKGFWTSFSESLSLASCDLNCTKNVYVNGIYLQQVDPFCKQSCVNDANYQANLDKKRRALCSDKNSEIFTDKSQLNKDIEEFEKAYKWQSKRHQELINREPSWPN